MEEERFKELFFLYYKKYVDFDQLLSIYFCLRNSLLVRVEYMNGICFFWLKSLKEELLSYSLAITLATWF